MLGQWETSRGIGRMVDVMCTVHYVRAQSTAQYSPGYLGLQ